MSEGKWTRDGYIPWTAELILDEAHAEAGPATCDISYQELCNVMAVAPELLSVLSKAVHDVSRGFPFGIKADWLDEARTLISKARGEA